jgi:transcriptional regulator with XRE-family HTH domain/energy-coupling factor transporter ATP-binding protein EcfA2
MRSSRHSKTPGLFGSALAGLIDRTGVFSRSEWATYLGISESAISQWIHGHTVPRADLLKTIYQTLLHTAGVPREPLEEFQRVAELPAATVSLLGTRMEPTVSEYMKRGGLGDLGRQLRAMNAKEKRTFLEAGSIGDANANPARGPVVAGVPINDVNSVYIVDQGIFGEEMNRNEPTRAHVSPLIDPSLLPRLIEMERDGSPSRSIDWQRVLESRRALILGRPGSGKTTLLNHLADRIRRESAQPPTILVARDEDPRHLAGFLKALEQASAGEHAAVLFDGLDELPVDRRENAAKAIDRFAETHPEAQVLLTSRPIREVEHLKHFRHFNPAPLSTVQVAWWLQRALGESSVPIDSAELNRYVCHLVEQEDVLEKFRTPLFMKTAWSLFVRHGVTPFSETELVGHFARQVLDEWDRDKCVIRARAPWASPQRLQTALELLSFSLVQDSISEFRTRDCEKWLGSASYDVSMDRLLGVLSEQSGIVRKFADTWRVVDHACLNYYAASYVVDNCRDASEIIGAWAGHDHLHPVLRQACGMTNDAELLLSFIMEKGKAPESERVAMLAKAIAQPLVAGDVVLAQICERIVSWLEEIFKTWEVERSDRREMGECLWKRRLARKSNSAMDDRVWVVLGDLHRARSGPAKTALVHRLSKARGPVLRALPEALEVEGKFEVIHERDNRSVLAQVVEPKLG